jgi:imidazolonepropionase
LAQPILLRGAKQLLTLGGPTGVRRGADLRNLSLIQDGSVLIRDGLIASVGSTRRLENLKEVRGALDIPVHGRVVMPSFVDAGLHISLSHSKTSYKPKRASDFQEDSLALMRGCLLHGTVTADVKASADAADYHSDVSVLRKIAKIGDTPVRLFRSWRMGQRPLRDEAARTDLVTTLRTLIDRGLIHAIALEPSSEHSDELDLLLEAKEAGAKFHIIWSGGTPRLFEDLIGRLQPSCVFYKCEPNASEANILADKSTVAVLPAGKHVFEGPPTTIGRDLVDSGVAVALSSGYHSITAASFSMQMSIALAVTRLGLTVEEAIAAATVNAAYAIGCSGKTGTLEIGKQADLIILNVPDYRDIPEQFGINHVAMVFRSGTIALNRTRWRAPSDSQSPSRMRSKLL